MVGKSRFEKNLAKYRGKVPPVFHLIVGILLDAVDYILIGMIPGLGDVVDAVGILYFCFFLGPLGVAPAIELVPGLDILPTNMITGFYAFMSLSK